jgi:hypothetical protein
MKGLIIRKEWLDKIFNDGKIWEMRSSACHHRGKIYLIESGTKFGTIVGEAEITGSWKIEPCEFSCTKEFHHVDDLSLLNKWCHAWVLNNVVEYDTPIHYERKKGQVIWVDGL